MLISGTPGIGKTAFMAMFCNREKVMSVIRQNDLPENQAEIFKSFRHKTDIIGYFIVRGDITTKPAEFLKTVLENIDIMYSTKPAITENEDDLLVVLHK
ncbi:MAG: hypothetical protein GY749_45305 [Desulfobacteraceae bacterium]|nr:hypothetical protein [Desulfobacteraceae bacterium]